MALLDGKKKPMRSGGNFQREKFSEGVASGGAGGGTGGGAGGGRGVSGMGKAPGKPELHTSMTQEPEPDKGHSGQTTIMHGEDGSHTVKHADGEETEHPNIHHAMMAVASKHESGDHGVMHHHGGMPEHPHEGMEEHHTVTTHHVGMDGEVQGPHHHGSPEEAGQHLASMMGDDGHGLGEPSMPMDMGPGDYA